MAEPIAVIVGYEQLLRDGFTDQTKHLVVGQLCDDREQRVVNTAPSS